VDGGTCVSGCTDGVGMVGIVVDGGASVGASDGVGTVATEAQHTRRHTHLLQQMSHPVLPAYLIACL